VGDSALLSGQVEFLKSFSCYAVPVITVVFNLRSYDCPCNGILSLTKRGPEKSESPPAEREASGSPMEGGIYRLTYLNVQYRTRNIE
jgi:hypothetical protein